MPKQYPTRASLHRSDAAAEAPAAPAAPPTAPAAPLAPADAFVPADTLAPSAPATVPASAPGVAPAPTELNRPSLPTRAERRRREQAALESTALLQPVDGPDARRTAPAPFAGTVAEPAAPQVSVHSSADPAFPASGPITRPQWAPVRPMTAVPCAAAAETPVHVTRGAAFGPAAASPAGHEALLTRAERRRLAMAEELAGLPEPVPSWRPTEASAADTVSRMSRREAEHAARQRRRSDRQRAAQPASLAAVAGALIVAIVVVDPIGAVTAPSLTEDDHLRIAEGALENRGGAASRAGERDALPEAVHVAAAPEVAVEKAEVVASAAEVLGRAATLVSTETRTTPEQREEVIAKAAVVRELSNRLATGASPAPADPELVEVVTAALMSVAVADGGGVTTASAADAAGADLQPVAGTEPAAGEEAPTDGHELPGEPAAVDLDDPELIARALAAATATLGSLLEAAAPLSIAVEPRPMTAPEVLAQQITEAQADSARLTEAYGASVAGFQNGRIPTSAMSELSWAPGHFLRGDAAAQLERLNVAFRAQFGVDIHITDSYRSFEGQVRARANRGRMAAVPGTSNHGWGVAVDLGGGINRFGSAAHRWMREHAEDFGWTLPAWARERGRLPEPWHWEFEGAAEVGAD